MSSRSPDGARSLFPHVVGLLLIMLIALPIVGWHGVVSSDEGAGIAQAQAIGEERSFFLPHPFPQADPTGAAFPLGAHVTDAGFAPLAKKPAYTVTLALADLTAGVPGMLLLSIVGTVAAATSAALIAGHLNNGYRLITFWVTGLVSPLFTDGYLVIAHTVGAAFCGAAMLGALRAMERATVARLATIGAGLIIAIALRREAALFGAALAIALGGAAVINRDTRTTLATGAALGGTVAGYLLDRFLSAAAFGTGVDGLGELRGASSVMADGLVASKVKPFVTTWLSPNYGDLNGSGLLLLVLAAAGAGGALQLRRRDLRERTIRALAIAVIAISAAIASLLATTQSHLVPGLLPAFPLLVWGLVLLDRATLTIRSAQVLMLTGSLFAMAVLATQSAIGGGWEWGGRYFAVGLPAVTPLISAGLMRTRGRLNGETARACVTAVAASSLVLSVMGLASIRYFHDSWRDFVSSVSEVAYRTDPGDGGYPVVVSTEPELPRAAWSEMRHSRWLLVPEEEVIEMLERLSSLNIEEMVFVTKGDTTATAIRESPYAVKGENPAPQDLDTWWVTTLYLPQRAGLRG